MKQSKTKKASWVIPEIKEFLKNFKMMAQISSQQFVVYHRNMSQRTVPGGQNGTSESNTLHGRTDGIVNTFKPFKSRRTNLNSGFLI